MRAPTGRVAPDRGAAVVDFVLIMVLLVPLVLGVAQGALVLPVRNTAAAAASDGAARTRTMIRDTLADRYADDVTASSTTVGGVPGTEIVVRARVPALGLFGPSVRVTVRGHAVNEVAP
jgi:Flp pilus assembly protein TadG